MNTPNIWISANSIKNSKRIISLGKDDGTNLNRVGQRIMKILNNSIRITSKEITSGLKNRSRHFK